MVYLNERGCGDVSYWRWNMIHTPLLLSYGSNSPSGWVHFSFCQSQSRRSFRACFIFEWRFYYHSSIWKWKTSHEVIDVTSASKSRLWKRILSSIKTALKSNGKQTDACVKVFFLFRSLRSSDSLCSAAVPLVTTRCPSNKTDALVNSYKHLSLYTNIYWYILVH